MKRMIALVLVMMLTFPMVAFAANAAQTEYPYSNMYTNFNARFYQNRDNEHLLIEIHWKNISKKARSFNWAFDISVYQHGKSVKKDYFPRVDTNDTADILPGYDTYSYIGFKLEDESDIQVVIDYPFNFVGMKNATVFGGNVNDLPLFEE